MSDDAIVVDAEQLRQFVTRVLEELRVPSGDAREMAGMIVETDLRGVDSHGVARFPYFTGRLRSGLIDPVAQPEVVHETPTTLVIDAHNGLGYIVGALAMGRCIAKARDAGVGIAAVRASNHLGAAATYAMMALEHDMIGFCTTNGFPLIPPTFGAKAMFGANPFCIAIPAGECYPFVLDCSTSTVAFGKLEIAARKGTTIPIGWARDKEGRDTTDPKAAMEGLVMLPLGGTREQGSHKGYGLAMIMEILVGLLSSGAYGWGVKHQADLYPGQADVSQFFAALNITFFRPVDEFKAAMDSMIREIHSSPKEGGQERIFIPGEIEYETLKMRQVEGIPLHPAVVEGLRKVAEEVGVPFNLA